MNQDFLNSAGYPDPTPYEAIRAIEAEEKKAKRVFRPIVYSDTYRRGFHTLPESDLPQRV